MLAATLDVPTGTAVPSGGWRGVPSARRLPARRWRTPLRRLANADELLDGALDDPRTLEGNLRDLARVNRWLGGAALSARAVDSLARRSWRPLDGEPPPLSVLDVGTGAADIPVALLETWRRRGERLEVTGIDDRDEVLAAARAANPGIDAAPRLTLARADGRALPYEDEAFDIAHCSLVLHHLDEAEAVRLLRELRRVSRLGVVVNDLARGRAWWLGAWLLAHIATRNPYTRHDAPLSVRRAWSVREARALLAVAGLRPVAEHYALLGHRWAIAAVRA